MTGKVNTLLIDDYLTEKVGVCEVKSGEMVIIDPTNDSSILMENEFIKTPVAVGSWIVELDRDPESYDIAALCLWHEEKAKNENCTWDNETKTILASNLVECIDASSYSTDEKAMDLKQTLSKCYIEIVEDGYYTQQEENALIESYKTNRLTVNDTMDEILKKDIIQTAGILFKSGVICMANAKKAEYHGVDLLRLNKEVVGIQIAFLYPDKDAPNIDDEIDELEALEVNGCI